MIRLIARFTIVCCFLQFIFSFNALDVLGWKINSGNVVTKIHPVTYCFVLAAGCAVIAFRPPTVRRLSSPSYLLFLLAGCILVCRAALIASSGVTAGELSAAIVTWMTPAGLLLAISILTKAELRVSAIGLRAFFAIDSLLAIAEQVRHFHVFPSLVEGLRDARSTALLGTPLNGALLTGVMIVYLVSSRGSLRDVALRLPEILLHAVALFAFGGRSALIFTALIALVSNVFVLRRTDQMPVSATQRLVPFLLLGAGVVLVLSGAGFIGATIDRFSDAGKSSATRESAIRIVNLLTTNEWLFGMESTRQGMVQTFFGTPYGIELAWVALIVTYGLLCVIPMMIALPWLLWRVSRPLDRSAFYMALLFLFVTAGSLSFASKSLLVSQTFCMMILLCQPRLLGHDLRPTTRAR